MARRPSRARITRAQGKLSMRATKGGKAAKAKRGKAAAAKRAATKRGTTKRAAKRSKASTRNTPPRVAMSNETSNRAANPLTMGRALSMMRGG